MTIKIVAFDIYGTILASDDTQNEFRPRLGFREFATRCREEGKLIVTASDAPIIDQKRDLSSTFNTNKKRTNEIITLDFFHNFYLLDGNPKNFNLIALEYSIDPSQIFVFGDSKQKDIDGAIEWGCPYFQVPEYRIKDKTGNFLPPDTFSFMGQKFF